MIQLTKYFSSETMEARKKWYSLPVAKKKKNEQTPHKRKYTDGLNKYMKRCSTTYVIKEWQIKTRQHCTPMRMVKIQNTNTTKHLQNVEQQEFSFTDCENEK